jgi:hypothetical protein
MITIDDKKRDVLAVIMALLWAFVLYAAWSGAINKNSDLIFYGMIASALIVFCFYLMGAITNEKMSIPVLIFPVIINLVLWIIAFTMAYQTRGQKMDFILGMHPGMFGMIIIFWVGTMICTAVSFGLWFDKYYLPEAKWAEFQKEVSQLEKIH